ncbi:hypothetical protein EMCRGX_G026946 [Ephydatia muelleri]
MLVPPTSRGRSRLASGDVAGGVTLVTRPLSKAPLPLVNRLVFCVSLYRPKQQQNGRRIGPRQEPQFP